MPSAIQKREERIRELVKVFERRKCPSVIDPLLASAIQLFPFVRYDTLKDYAVVAWRILKSGGTLA